MGNLRIEPRADGSLVLTHAGGARWGVALAWIGAGLVLLGALVRGEVTVLGGVVLVPLVLIAILAGLGTARHRDWILFDRQAREIVFRRGLTSIFRPVSALPFDDVEAIRVEAAEADAGTFRIELVRAGDAAWPVDQSSDAAYVARLVTALHDVGGWPVLRAGARQRPPYRITTADSRP